MIIRRIGSTRALWLVGAVVIAAAIWFGLRLRRPSIEQDARTILSEIEEGDGNGLYHHAYDHERTALGLTPDKIDGLYHQLILPRFQGFHPVGAMQAMVNHDASQAMAWQVMRDSKGREFALDATPWASVDGGRQMVMARLMTAWIVEYRICKGKATDSEGCAEARLEGLAHDRTALAELGIPGMVSDNPQMPMQTWDEFQKYWQNMAAKLRAEKSPANNVDRRL